ncbi:hypothetical protein SAMN05877753_103425 [Bacillus oleivorans]|uniref:Uncharacterized protein n=1 Tax=Bacillus oleivorans TaxID=1448271 RepID=A0A285CR80_9BACI|nr:hypothetical protein [Bacillus oleivorans]SNX70042.1 hypothetical protein SAMN05877753_103425 [Bacillus oleivorans]
MTKLDRKVEIESLRKLLKDQIGWESGKTSLRGFLNDQTGWKRGKNVFEIVSKKDQNGYEEKIGLILPR